MGTRGTKGRKGGEGFVAFASLGLLLFLFGIFTFTFFLQANFAKRTQAAVVRSQAQALATISASAASSRFAFLGELDRALAQSRYQTDPIQTFLNAERRRPLGCPSFSSSFWVAEGANYTSGSCAAFVQNVADTAFNQNPVKPFLIPYARKHSSPNYPYAILQYPLRYAVVSLSMGQGLEVPVSAGVTVGQVNVFLLRPSGSGFPYPFWFQSVDPATLPPSYPSAPGHVWNAPVLFSGLASSSSLVYPTYLPSSGWGSPPVFAMGLHLSGCSTGGTCAADRSTPLGNAQFSTLSSSGTALVPGSQLLPDPYRPSGRASQGQAYLGMGATYFAHPMVASGYFSGSLQPLPLTPTLTYSQSGPLTVEVWADSPTAQGVRILDALGNQLGSHAFSSGHNILYFPNATSLSIRVPQGKVYAVAPRAGYTLLFLAQSADIFVESDLLAHSPYCTRPIEVRYTESGYELVEECPGPLHTALFGLATRYGNIQLNYLKPTMNFNGVFFAAPYGAFRLASGALPVSGTGVTASSTINLHLVGGIFARTFGPWHNSAYNALDFNFYMSDLPLSSSTSWSNWIPVDFDSTANLAIAPAP